MLQGSMLPLYLLIDAITFGGKLIGRKRSCLESVLDSVDEKLDKLLDLRNKKDTNNDD